MNFPKKMDKLEFIESIKSAKRQLEIISNKENVIEEIKYCLSCWNYQSVDSLEQFQNELDQVIDEIKELIFPNENNNNRLNKLIRFVILDELYDFIISLMRKKFSSNDVKIYKLSKEFCNSNGTPKLLGATFYNFIPNAAVIELSMLTNKRTPIEKLTCLTSVYDYIFVEIKSALISIISKYSDKEVDIPIINNQDVLPVLMAVILKSKLFYLFSDLYYVTEFGSDLIENNSNLHEIYYLFKQTLDKLFRLRLNDTDILIADKLNKELNVCETITFIDEVTGVDGIKDEQTVFQEEKRRVAKMIVTATTSEVLDD